MRGGPGEETAGMPPLPCQAMMCDDDDYDEDDYNDDNDDDDDVRQDVC